MDHVRVLQIAMLSADPVPVTYHVPPWGSVIGHGKLQARIPHGTYTVEEIAREATRQGFPCEAVGGAISRIPPPDSIVTGYVETSIEALGKRLVLTPRQAKHASSLPPKQAMDYGMRLVCKAFGIRPPSRPPQKRKSEGSRSPRLKRK